MMRIEKSRVRTASQARKSSKNVSALNLIALGRLDLQGFKEK